MESFDQFRQRYAYDPNRPFRSGGQGTIYEAFDKERQCKVAIKRSEYAPGKEKYSIKKEFELGRRMRHVNLLKYYEAHRLSTTMGVFDYGVMEFIEKGHTLDDFLITFPEDDQLKEVLTGILNGLDYLHSQEVVHRDVKPANILIEYNEDGATPKIIDFGISKELEAGEATLSGMLGTVEYMAPEQINPAPDQKLTASCDLWAFGVIIYRIFTGEMPFGAAAEGNTQSEITSRILDGKLPAAVNTIQEPYRRIVKRCLVLDPKRRIQSAKEVIDMLSAPSGQPVAAPLSRMAAALGKRPRFVALGGGGLLVVALLSFFLWQWAQDNFDSPFGEYDVYMAYAQGHYGFVDAKGRHLFGFVPDSPPFLPSEGLLPTQQDGKYGFVDRMNKLELDFQYDTPTLFREGVALILPTEEGDTLLINRRGETIRKLSFTEIDTRNGALNFQNGLVRIETPDGYGFMNTEGELVIEPQYDEAFAFSEGVAYVEKEERAFFIDNQGEVLVELPDDISLRGLDFQEGLTIFSKEGKYGFIDTNGDIKITAYYEDVRPFHNGVALAKMKDKWGLIDTEGKELVQFKYPDLPSSGWDHRYADDRIMVGKSTEEFGFIDKTGRECTSFIYDDGFDFSEGLAAVAVGEKWGYIDVDGGIKIPYKYDWAGPFHQGAAVVRKEEEFAVIDRQGNFILPFSPRRILYYDDFLLFREGVMITVGPYEGDYESRLAYCDSALVLQPEDSLALSLREVYAGKLDRQNWWDSLDLAWREFFDDEVGYYGDPTDEELQEMMALEEVDISGNEDIESLEPLRRLTELEFLNAMGTPVTDLSPLDSLKKLRTLAVGENPYLTSLKGLEGLTSLEKLYCYDAGIESLEPIAGLTGLTFLSAFNNRINSLEPLRDLTGLTRLFLYGNEITNGELGYLRNLGDLEVLSIYDNPLDNLDQIRGIGAIEVLQISYDQIEEVSLRRFRQAHEDCLVRFL